MKPEVPGSMDKVTFHFRLVNATTTLIKYMHIKTYKQTIQSAKLLFTGLPTTMQRYHIKWANSLAQ